MKIYLGKLLLFINIAVCAEYNQEVEGPKNAKISAVGLDDVNDSSYWVSYHTIFFNPIPKGLKLEYASEEQRQLLNGLVTRVTKLFVFCERDNEKIKIKTWRVQVPFVQITLKDKDDPFGSVIRTDFKNLKLINFDKSVKKLALKYDLNSFEIDYDPLQK